MTIKEFIEDAVQGGYIAPDVYTKLMSYPKDGFTAKQAVDYGQEMESLIINSIIFDPEAWKAVGKVKGRKVGGYPYVDEIVNNHRTGFVAPYEGVDWYGEYWQYAMHLMIDALIKGKSLEEYIATL